MTVLRIVVGRALRQPKTESDLVDRMYFGVPQGTLGKPGAVGRMYSHWHTVYGDGGTTYGPWRLYHLLLEEIEE